MASSSSLVAMRKRRIRKWECVFSSAQLTEYSVPLMAIQKMGSVISTMTDGPKPHRPPDMTQSGGKKSTSKLTTVSSSNMSFKLGCQLRRKVDIIVASCSQLSISDRLSYRLATTLLMRNQTITTAVRPQITTASFCSGHRRHSPSMLKYPEVHVAHTRSSYPTSHTCSRSDRHCCPTVTEPAPSHSLPQLPLYLSQETNRWLASPFSCSSFSSARNALLLTTDMSPHAPTDG
mmetsp:Transcript_3844/g.7053  ORF Transcript_3844/g.7053 Transcript_3844/m.7053 type:complete len:233 (+) Transcript_3844:80-778(+)